MPLAMPNPGGQSDGEKPEEKHDRYLETTPRQAIKPHAILTD